MTRQQSGHQGGVVSGEIRRLQMRQRAVLALGFVPGHEQEAVRALIASGALDAFLAHLEHLSYQRGYQTCAGRQERAQARAAREVDRAQGRARLLADLGATA